MSENAAIIRRVYEAFATRDVDTVMTLIDPATITVRQSDELPWGGTYEGADGFLTYFGKIRETITSQVETEVIYDAGDRVVQIGRTRGTVNTTGVAFDLKEAHVWEVRVGKAVSMHAMIDNAAIVTALAAKAP